jgi:hypothetical protein
MMALPLSETSVKYLPDDMASHTSMFEFSWGGKKNFFYKRGVFRRKSSFNNEL